MIKAMFQFILKSSCVLYCSLAVIIGFVAILAFFFDSHLPGTSIYHTFEGNFGGILLFALASIGIALLLYSKLPPFNDIFSR